MCRCSHHILQHKEGVSYPTSFSPGHFDCKGMLGSETPGFIPCNCKKFEPWDGPWDAKTGQAANVQLTNLSTAHKAMSERTRVNQTYPLRHSHRVLLDGQEHWINHDHAVWTLNHDHVLQWTGIARTTELQLRRWQRRNEIEGERLERIHAEARLG